MPRAKKGANENQDDSQSSKASLEIRSTQQFDNDYNDLTSQQTKEVDSTLQLLLTHGGFTPGMRPKKLRGHRNIWYIRASLDTRITFEYGENNMIALKRVGSHDVLKNP